MANSASFTLLFKRLDELLYRYRNYWQFSPFEQPTSAWQNPQLDAYLDLAKPPPQQQPLQRQYSELDEDLVAFFPDLAEAHASLPIPSSNTSKLATPFWLNNGIKGRKAEQIQAFSEQLQGETLPILEWCAGKGHLGRLLSYHHQLAVDSLEWQVSLCQAGQQTSDKLNLPQQFHHCDVLSPQAQVFIKPQQHVVGLHACGDLHLQLLRLAGQQQPQRLSLCPCCYHLIAHTHYQPLSNQAQQSRLSLSRADLRLAVAQSVTSGQRVQTLRQREIHWRLSYQCLREQITGKQHYQALASVAKHWFGQQAAFIDFACWAAQQHGLDLPQHIDEQQLLHQGKLRHQQVQKLEQVQQLFRPLIERWLVLDRCLYLQQQGYHVELIELFPFTTSPRNILIQAELGPRS